MNKEFLPWEQWCPKPDTKLKTIQQWRRSSPVSLIGAQFRSHPDGEILTVSKVTKNGIVVEGEYGPAIFKNYKGVYPLD